MAMRRWDEQLIYSDRRTYLPLPSGFSALDPSAEAGAYRSTRLPQRQQSLCRLVFFSASYFKPRLRLQKLKRPFRVKMPCFLRERGQFEFLYPNRMRTQTRCIMLYAYTNSRTIVQRGVRARLQSGGDTLKPGVLVCSASAVGGGRSLTAHGDPTASAAPPKTRPRIGEKSRPQPHPAPQADAGSVT